ncbi:hypothetical protein B7494_g5240 [Chlorociboria aeruginascens]|nr:hypothetical protein B7494_g5240 [Chlorociboria aeruginascens]
MADFEVISRSNATLVGTGLKPPRDLSHHYSKVTAARQASSMKDFYKFFLIPGIGNLAGGLPNAQFFPFETLEAQTAHVERFKPTPNDPNDLSQNVANISLKTPSSKASSHIIVPHAAETSNPLQKIDLTTALQYGTAQGYPPLYSFLRQFTQENLHPNVPYLDGPEIILTNGNTDGFGKALEALSNTWSPGRDEDTEREGILCEEFAYMNAIQSSRPRGLQVVPVKIDFMGMLPTGPGSLEDVLENWDVLKGKRPHLMYTVTIGQNPTGSTISIQRRKELYAICSKYDVIIVEDDPYWYLQYPSAAPLQSQSRNEPVPPPAAPHTFKNSSGFPFLDSLVPSYLNFDPDGRVIRLDTFSKTVAPGCRLGWITAQPAIIERILRITETSTQQPSGFVQSIVAELLLGPQLKAPEIAKKSKKELASFSGWKTEGWVRWLEGLRGSYERRMNVMCTILENGRYLLKQGTPLKPSESEWAVISKTKLFSFDWPRGGMFVWLETHLESHPLAAEVPGPALAHALWIYLTMKPFLVLVGPGLLFCPNEEIQKKGWRFFRLCFAAVSDEEVEKYSKAFTDGITAFFKIKDKKELDDIESAVNIGGAMNMAGERDGELVDLSFDGSC